MARLPLDTAWHFPIIALFNHPITHIFNNDYTTSIKYARTVVVQWQCAVLHLEMLCDVSLVEMMDVFKSTHLALGWHAQLLTVLQGEGSVVCLWRCGCV
jgi:hypothetical protein